MLDGGGKRGLQTFRRAQEIESFHIFRVALEPRFGKLYRRACQTAKLLDHARVRLVLFLRVERVRVVERRLQAARFMQGLRPKGRGKKLRPGRMVWKESRQLIEFFARRVVVQIIQSLKPGGSQFFKARG